MRQSLTRAGKPAARHSRCEFLALSLILILLTLALPVGARAAVSIGSGDGRTQGVASCEQVLGAASAHASVGRAVGEGGIVIARLGTIAVRAGVMTAPPAPTVVRFTPTSGPVGARVTIVGLGFTGATDVTLNGRAATFSVDDDTHIAAMVPAGATSGKLAVTTPGGTSTSAATFTVVVTPTITSFTPTSGAVGTVVTLTGSGYVGATKVTFNGTAATFSLASSTRITATVPSGATTGKLAVTTRDGTAASATSFTVTPSPAPPTVTSFTPASGPVGAGVTISGSGFTGATKVTFHGTAANFNVVSSTRITATVPSGATSGSIAVTTPGGTASSSWSFIVAAAPSITSFTPTSGPVGTNVTISGSGFTGTTAVTFHGTAANFNVVSSTRITATVPSGATSGTIAVTNPGGKGTSTTSFIVIAAPTVTSFTPTSGPVGTSVSVNGTGFTGATAVTFSGRAATFSVVSAARITAIVPAGATGGPIAVTTPAGTATSAASFTVMPVPAITYFTPTSGPAGTVVTLIGSALSGATAVSFNGVRATFSLISDTQITATVPAGATSGSIAVTTRGGSGSSAASFTVIPAPVVFRLNRTSGQRGATVTIGGSGFGAPRGASSVKFGNKMCSKYLSWSDTQIKCKVPAEASYGKVKVTVMTEGGTSSAVGFRVKQ